MNCSQQAKWWLVAAAVAASFIGCNNNPTSTITTPPDTAWQQSVNMSTSFGSYAFTSESAGFGDPQVSAVDSEENPVSLADPDSVRTDSTTVLRVLWGQVRGNPAITTRTDWTGTISVNLGRMAVLRRIGFEVGDHLVFPRPNRRTLGIVSHTGPYADGLVLLIHEPPTASNVTFTFATAAYTNTWSLDSLRTQNVVVQVDSTGDAVSITGVPRSTPACPDGFTRGHWLRRTGSGVPAGVQGFFRGLWIGDDGGHAGFIRGHFGLNTTGDSVWFGKIIDRNGHLVGLARGTWVTGGDPTRPQGTFSGQWFAALNTLSGTVSGHYVLGHDTVLGQAGFFDGNWKSTCTP
jgi:hypothetical protein